MPQPYPWHRQWEHLYTAHEKVIWDYANNLEVDPEVRCSRIKRLDRELSNVITRLPPGKSVEERVRKLLRQPKDKAYYVPWTPRRQRKAYVELWEIHPRALRLLERHGVWQKPFVWDKPIPFGYPENNGEPQHGGCYEDAILFMKIMALVKRRDSSANNVGYCEGITLGACTVPMLHAWNWVDRKPEIAIDWNQYASGRWTLYLGFSFTQEEHRKIMDIQHGPTKSGSIFHRKWFTRRAENFIRDLLEERKRKQRQQEQEICKEAAD